MFSVVWVETQSQILVLRPDFGLDERRCVSRSGPLTDRSLELVLLHSDVPAFAVSSLRRRHVSSQISNTRSVNQFLFQPWPDLSCSLRFCAGWAERIMTQLIILKPQRSDIVLGWQLNNTVVDYDLWQQRFRKCLCKSDHCNSAHTLTLMSEVLGGFLSDNLFLVTASSAPSVSQTLLQQGRWSDPHTVVGVIILTLSFCFTEESVFLSGQQRRPAWSGARLSKVIVNLEPFHFTQVVPPRCCHNLTKLL